METGEGKINVEHVHQVLHRRLGNGGIPLPPPDGGPGAGVDCPKSLDGLPTDRAVGRGPGMRAAWWTGTRVWLLMALLALCGEPVIAAEQPLRLSDGTINVNGVDIFYRIGGSGPPLLLLHGFTGVGHWWDGLLDDFGQHYTVIVPDLRGHGRSTSPPGEFSYRESARDMFGLLDHLGIQRIQGIGYSAGGCTLLHMAAQQRGRVEAMILVAGGHRLTSGSRQDLRDWPPLEQLPGSYQSYYRQVHPGGDSQVRSLLSQLRASAENYEDFGFSPEHLSTIPARALMVWGDQDHVEVAFELHRSLPDSALWVIPGQGHLAVWKEWGGSQLAAELFPKLALEFLGKKQTE